MADVHAEDDRLAASDVLEVGVDDQPVARRHQDLFLQFPAVVLDLVEPDAAQVDVRVDADATDGEA